MVHIIDHSLYSIRTPACVTIRAMNVWMSIAGILVVATMTPGPNNLVVMHKASLSGFGAALPAIMAIVCGGITLLALVMIGVGALYALVPGLSLAITAAGCAYLAWLGFGLFIRTFSNPGSGNPATSTHLPDSFAGLFAFQFLNPKGWVMLLTVTSAASAAPTHGRFPYLAGLFVLTSVAGLLMWSGLGTLMARRLRHRRNARQWFDRLAGGLLLASAMLLVFDL